MRGEENPNNGWMKKKKVNQSPNTLKAKPKHLKASKYPDKKIKPEIASQEPSPTPK